MSTKNYLLLTALAFNFGTAYGTDPSWSPHAGPDGEPVEYADDFFQNCTKNVREVSERVCKSLNNIVDLNKKQLAKIDAFVSEMDRTDNMWWNDQRSAEVRKLSADIKNKKSLLHGNRQVWCDGRSKMDAKDLCILNAKDYDAIVRTHSQYLVDLKNSVSNLEMNDGFVKSMQKSADSMVEEVKKLVRKKPFVDPKNVEAVNKIVAQLSASKNRNSTAHKKLLKKCYELMEKDYEAFGVSRPEAPYGYDCMSFDPKMNP